MSTGMLASTWRLARQRVAGSSSPTVVVLPALVRQLGSSTASPSSPAPAPAPAYFRILALESSADDTAAACVDSDRKILSSVVVKQHDVHAQFRGIQPKYAQHAHTRNMPTAIRRALAEAQLGLDDVDAFAFTQGPGMFGCLSVACQSAGALAAATGKPLIGVNHMQGHALTALMTEADPPSFPFLTLLISGGHSQLLLATGLDAFDVVVDTGTLPLGTCFDRLGAALGLEYGTGLGPALEQTAARDPPQGTALPELRALTFPQNKSPTFDFDGILASLQHELIRLAPRASAAGAAGAESPPTSKTRHDPAGLTPAAQIAVARAFQDAVGRVLVKKVRAVLDARRAAGLDEVGSLVVSGGVACNAHIRQALLALGRETHVRVLFPPLALCTDNAAMIANAAVHRLAGAVRLNALDDVLPRAKWSLEQVAEPAPSI